MAPGKTPLTLRAEQLGRGGYSREEAKTALQAEFPNANVNQLRKAVKAGVHAKYS